MCHGALAGQRSFTAGRAERVIRFSHVSHSGFHSGTGLTNVSFHIPVGEPSAIIGPVGSGQDLIMKMCTLDLIPYDGKVMIDGKDTRAMSLSDIRRLRRATGTISQSLPLLRDRSVLENITLPLEIRGWPRRRAVRRALKALESADILESKGISPDELPLGDQAMVCLARAIASGPRLMLADRVMPSLPRKKAQRTLAVLRDMAALGAAVILLETSVDPSELTGWRVYSLEAGNIVNVTVMTVSDHTGRKVSLVDRLLESSS
jgi:ABC-type ATPase involved in cell division